MQKPPTTMQKMFPTFSAAGKAVRAGVGRSVKNVGQGLVGRAGTVKKVGRGLVNIASKKVI